MTPSVDDIAAAISDGRVVVIPTDTLYGLAANPRQPAAIDRLFAVKRRPRDVELPVFVASATDARDLAVVPAWADPLTDAFWPGPLTIVLARRAGIALDAGASSTTVGLRVPGHELCLALCSAVGPIAVTSANRHQQPTPPTAEEIDSLFGDEVELIVDGGRCEGEPSTVIDATGDAPKLLREGRLPWTEVLRTLS